LNLLKGTTKALFGAPISLRSYDDGDQ